jgi:hypothetical protein
VTLNSKKIIFLIVVVFIIAIPGWNAANYYAAGLVNQTDLIEFGYEEDFLYCQKWRPELLDIDKRIERTRIDPFYIIKESYSPFIWSKMYNYSKIATHIADQHNDSEMEKYHSLHSQKKGNFQNLYPVRMDVELVPEKPYAPNYKKNALLKKMEDIVIPKIKFVNGDFETVVDFIVSESKRLDPENEGIRIIILEELMADIRNIPLNNTRLEEEVLDNFETEEGAGEALDDFEIEDGASEYRPVEKTFPKLDIELDDIPIGELINYIVHLLDLRYSIGDDAVIFRYRGCHYQVQTLENWYIDQSFLFALALDQEDMNSVGLVEYFEQFGIRFPTTPNGKSASITYNPNTRLLNIKNTQEELRKIRRLITEISGAKPKY